MREVRLADGTKIIVRKATEKDAGQIAALWNSIVDEKDFSIGRDKIPIEKEREFLRSRGEREGIFVAEKDGEIIGYLNFTILLKACLTTLHAGETGTYVKKDWRRKGVATALSDYMEEWAKNNEFIKLIACFRSGNKNSKGFYEGRGFTEVGRLAKQLLFENGYEDLVWVEKFL